MERQGGTSKRSRHWGFMAGLLAGGTVALMAASASTLTSTLAARQGGLARQESRVDAHAPDLGTAGPAVEPDDAALAARWAGLSARFLEAAGPLTEAFRRADRLSEELPARQSEARDAEAAYRSARGARAAAELREAAYVETAAGIEEKAAHDEVTEADWIAGRAQAKLDDVRRNRDRVIAAWIAQGTPRKAAEGAATILFDKDVKPAEHQLQQALFDFNRAKARRDRIVRYERMKRTMSLRAEVEARRAREFACQAAWEKAKMQLAQLEARIVRSDLSRGERRLLDRLVEVVRASGSWPPSYGDRADRRAFLDRFEANLDGAMTVAVQLRAERYDDLLARLARAQGRSRGDGSGLGHDRGDGGAGASD